jgi:Fe-S-cluster-containing hydrogenase component 2
MRMGDGEKREPGRSTQQTGLRVSGVPSAAELEGCPGIVVLSGMKTGSVAVVECFEPIPCDPCIDVCPSNAISKEEIASVPELDASACTGCGLCVAACPGQAIFVVNTERGEVSLAHEFLPMPRKGDLVECLGRDGRLVQLGEVVRVVDSARSRQTVVVTVRVDPRAIMEVRAIRFGGHAP